jgi:hypothetical protein
MVHESLRVGVVGGSISGCATAALLSRAGHEVTVFRGLRDVRSPVSIMRHIISRQASPQPPPSKDEDWWKTLNDDEGLYHDGVMPLDWWEARIDDHWWKTATRDS